MTPGTAASLVNLLGFITGTVLYVMLLWMVLSYRVASNRLALLTGLLGFAWNVGAFGGYGLSTLALKSLHHWCWPQLSGLCVSFRPSLSIRHCAPSRKSPLSRVS